MRWWQLGLSLLLLTTTGVQACPCGCGVVSPMVLAGGECWRFLYELRQEAHRQVVDAHGQVGADDGPTHTTAATLGVARRVGAGWTLSAQGGAEQHRHPQATGEVAATDPSVGARYAFYTPEHVNSPLPSLQAHASYKQALARGMLEPAREPHSVDIHGNSYSELGFGLDAWFLQLPWTGGLGLQGIWRRPLRVEDEAGERLQQKGLALRFNTSLSYTFLTRGQITIKWEREQKQADQVDGEPLADSESLRHDVALQGLIKVALQRSISLQWQRTGFFPVDRNIARKDSVSLGYLVTL